ncbi:substrate-binding domain-containing protein [Kitasatospora sp. NPDC004240]
MHVRNRGLAAGALLLALGLTATACSAGQGSGADSAAVAPVSGRISITYLQKQGDQEYFVGEAAGARARAAELGVDLTVVNLGNDADGTVDEVEAAIARGADGIIVVVPDPAVGPRIVRAARDAKVALLTSDDQICATGPDPVVCARADLVPRVGFSGAQMGGEVGRRAAEEFRKAGWNPTETRAVSAWKQDVTVCRDRVRAAKEAFGAVAPGVRHLDVATDNTPAGALDRVAATVTANPGVRNWVVWGCNDENVQGGVTALQNAGIGADRVIGVGLGAYLACKDWSGNKPSGMRAALFINGKDVGALAVQTVYDRLRNGKEMPAETLARTTMVDPAGWRSAGVPCG